MSMLSSTLTKMLIASSRGRPLSVSMLIVATVLTATEVLALADKLQLRLGL